MENLFILTDLEGVGGVYEFAQTRERGPKNERAKILLTEELNAVISAINEYNPEIKIHIWDGHGSGGIVKEKLLPIEAFLPSGRIMFHEYFPQHEIDAVLFVGQHAMAGTPDANLSHTMSSRTAEYYKLNGVEIGEFGLRAYLSGELGVPTIFISGDDKACAEAKALIPEIVTCAVKTSVGLERAESLPFDEIYSALKTSIVAALDKSHDILPPVIEPPVEFEIKKKEGNWVGSGIGLIDKILRRDQFPRYKRLDKGHIIWNAESMVQLEKIKKI